MSAKIKVVNGSDHLSEEPLLYGDDAAMSRSRSVPQHLSCERDETTQHDVTPLRRTRSRKPTPYAFSMPKDSRVNFSSVQISAESHATVEFTPLRRSRRRKPTPFEFSLPADIGVQFRANAAPCNNELFEHGASVPCRRLRARLPTPFQYPSSQDGVRFGLTTLVAEEVPTGRRDRPRRLNSTELEDIEHVALRERERTPPPPGSQTYELDNADEESPRVRLNRHAFDDSFPSHNSSPTEECAVCHESLNGEDAKLFPCGHVFHNDCILQWFKHQLTCPLCRRSFVNELGVTRADAIPTHPRLDNAPRILRTRSMSI